MLPTIDYHEENKSLFWARGCHRQFRSVLLDQCPLPASIGNLTSGGQNKFCSAPIRSDRGLLPDVALLLETVRAVQLLLSVLPLTLARTRFCGWREAGLPLLKAFQSDTQSPASQALRGAFSCGAQRSTTHCVGVGPPVTRARRPECGFFVTRHPLCPPLPASDAA